MIDLSKHEKQICSQQGEDGIIEAIFDEIGTTSKEAVEFGALDAQTDNTLHLKHKGWKIHQWNGKALTPNIKKEFITAGNINRIFKKHEVSKDLDLLSIDIDFNDYYVWESLRWKPRVVVIEHNASIPPTEARIVKYDAKRTWDGTNYFGASLLALEQLAKRKGYSLVYVESQGVNAFFVRDDVLGNLQPLSSGEAYQTPKYGCGPNGGHPRSHEEMIFV